jgi:hypothetical protein
MGREGGENPELGPVHRAKLLQRPVFYVNLRITIAKYLEVLMPKTIGYPDNYDFSPEELLDVAMAINTAAKGEPVFLNEEEFRAWIERSSLKYHLEADKLIKEAIANIKTSSDKKELDLAIEKLSQARLVAQHSFIYANSSHDITNPKLTGWQPRRLKT